MDDSSRKGQIRPIIFMGMCALHRHVHTHTHTDSHSFLFLSSQSKSRGARKQFLTGIATFRMGSSHLPLTNAGSMVLGKSRRTFTCEATDGVNTQELAVVLLSRTLIKIYKSMQDGHWS